MKELFHYMERLIDSIKVIRSGKVRRAKLYYLRDRTGKSARIAEKIRKKIGIDVDVKPETVTEENVVPVSDAPKEVEAAPAAEAPKEEAPAAEKFQKKNQNQKAFRKKIIFFSMSTTLYDKIWNDHLVDQQDDGTALIVC